MVKRALACLLLAFTLGLGAPTGDAACAEPARGWAYDLMNELMSPYCPGRSLIECPSPDATELRLWIQGQEAAGVSRAAGTCCARLPLRPPPSQGWPAGAPAELAFWASPGPRWRHARPRCGCRRRCAAPNRARIASRKAGLRACRPSAARRRDFAPGCGAARSWARRGPLLLLPRAARVVPAPADPQAARPDFARPERPSRPRARTPGGREAGRAMTAPRVPRRRSPR